MKDIDTHKKNKPPDDGFRHIPKLRCPYGNHRFGDVPDLDFRNTVTLLKYDHGRSYGYGDAIFICPICHQRAVVHIKSVHGQVKVLSSAKRVLAKIRRQ